MLRWTFAAALTLVAAYAQAGLHAHGEECCAPSCAAPCECVPAGPCHGAPECAAPATCENGCPAGADCCASSECAAGGCAPSCCAPACDNGCTGGCHNHCAPKKKSCLARMWDLEKRKNQWLKKTFLGWAQ
jgi:hypothetical protein